MKTELSENVLVWMLPKKDSKTHWKAVAIIFGSYDYFVSIGDLKEVQGRRPDFGTAQSPKIVCIYSAFQQLSLLVLFSTSNVAIHNDNWQVANC